MLTDHASNLAVLNARRRKGKVFYMEQAKYLFVSLDPSFCHPFPVRTEDWGRFGGSGERDQIGNNMAPTKAFAYKLEKVYK